MLAKRLLFAPCAGGSPAEKAIAEWHEMRRGCGHHRRLRQGMVHRSLTLLWAAPWSLLGLLIGAVGLLSGGHVQRKGRILEFSGGCLPVILHVFPFYFGSPVATFGQVVLGRSDRYLNACRKHQLVHVRQYERWGLLFIPAYLTCSAALWFWGKPLLRQPLRALGVPAIGMTMRSHTQLLRLCNTSWLLLGRPKSVNRRRSPLSTNLRSVPGERTYGSRPRATMPSTTRLTAMSIAACRIVSPLCSDRS